MHEMNRMHDTHEKILEKNRLESLSILVGKGECNAYCRNCAGIPVRKYSPLTDTIPDEHRVSQVLLDCHTAGARRLSISSTGETTLSPLAIGRVLELYQPLKNEGKVYSPIAMYTNGIRIADEEFCDTNLPLWTGLGLTTIYVSSHHVDEKRNATAFAIPYYPPFRRILENIHRYGLLARTNLVLDEISQLEEFINTVNEFFRIGFDVVSAWPLREDEDRIDQRYVPADLEQMALWAEAKENVRVNIKPRKDKKLTLFPDGTLSESWCK